MSIIYLNFRDGASHSTQRSGIADFSNPGTYPGCVSGYYPDTIIRWGIFRPFCHKQKSLVRLGLWCWMYQTNSRRIGHYLLDSQRWSFVFNSRFWIYAWPNWFFIRIPSGIYPNLDSIRDIQSRIYPNLDSIRDIQSRIYPNLDTSWIYPSWIYILTWKNPG